MEPELIGLLQLSAADIAEARAVIEEAKQRPEFGNAFAPNVRIVGRDHWAFSGAGRKRSMMAARDEDGGEWILINKDGKPEDIREKAQHELGHLSAWRLYGEKIPEHGSKFQKECRKLVEHRQNAFCRGHW